jgi:hypothetical protein
MNLSLINYFNTVWLNRKSLLALMLYGLVASFCAPSQLNGAFTGDYTLAKFSLTNTNLNPADAYAANGYAQIDSNGWLVLTGSNTGSGLAPGSVTDLTIASKGTGIVMFDWAYSSLDFPEYDIGGYLLNGSFVALADTDGWSGSITFPVVMGNSFGFRVRTLDNQGEPGVLTIKNFSAPSSLAAIPEPSTFGLMIIGAAAVSATRASRVRRGRRQETTK